MNIIQRWKAKRALKKAAKVIEELCDNAPAGFFKNLIRNQDGTMADHVEARNILMSNTRRMINSL